jgi:spore coat protein SA
VSGAAYQISGLRDSFNSMLTSRLEKNHMIYHLLCEPFSAYSGLALSNVTANMMQFEESSIVVCPQADNTWGFGSDRIMVIPQLRVGNIRGWQHVPFWIKRPLLCRIFGRLLSKLREGDIVWCHNWASIAEAIEQEIHSTGAKLIYHAHNSLAARAARNGLRSLNPDALIFNSEAMRQEVLNLVPGLKNTFTIHNGVDEALFYPVAPGAAQKNTIPIILYVGRLVRIKGAHVLIEAMKILQERQVEATCKVVGSSHAGGSSRKVTPYMRLLQEECPANVEFVGFRAATDIAEEYRRADIFCCPSIWQEPFGSVNVEAMASGIPVIATRVGGIPEIAAGGGVLLVEPDSPVELADALQKLIQDKDFRAKMGTEALASFQQRFRWSAIVRQHQELLESLCDSKAFA